MKKYLILSVFVLVSLALPAIDSLTQAKAGTSPGLVAEQYPERAARGQAEGTFTSDPRQQQLDAVLRKNLADVQKVQSDGGWVKIPGGKFVIGDRNPAIVTIKQRLGVATDNENADLFDGTLELAIKQFQKKHALEEDGKLGPRTRMAINVPAENRAAQILVNLERLKWGGVIPQSGKAVIVNLPQYELNAYENGIPQIRSKVIVGNIERKTPLLASVINQIVVNPGWVAPPTIMSKDVLPKLRSNPEYLLKKGYEISHHGEPVGVYDVDWWSITPAQFASYRVSVPPGDKNPLGRVRFTLPDTGSIYLHDTSSRDLFAKGSRALSSGCVRVQAWQELASFVLDKNSDYDDARFNASLSKTNTQYIKLQQPIPVYFIYQTAWLNDENELVLANDVYDLDNELYKELIKTQSN